MAEEKKSIDELLDPDAIRRLPHTQVQPCIVHMVRNSLRYVSWKDRKGIAHDLRTIYSAPGLEAADQALEAFSQTWDEVTPLISRQWRMHRAHFRKVTKKRGVFPTEKGASPPPGHPPCPQGFTPRTPRHPTPRPPNPPDQPSNPLRPPRLRVMLSPRPLRDAAPALSA